MRKLKLANAQKRDAEIIYGGLIKKPKVHFTLPDGNTAKSIKLVKADVKHQYDALLAIFGEDEHLAQELVRTDPEIDLAKTGMIVTKSQKILVTPAFKPIYKVTTNEVVYNPDGTVKEEKAFSPKVQNIMGDFPISWTGKQMPISEVYNKFIFAKKYQLTHTNGLTFDFLYAMAKELYDKQVFMLMAAGAKGNEPLIFQENGKPYRAFLEGRIKDDSYLLIMHTSNLELKSIV